MGHDAFTPRDDHRPAPAVTPFGQEGHRGWWWMVASVLHGIGSAGGGSAGLGAQVPPTLPVDAPRRRREYRP